MKFRLHLLALLTTAGAVSALFPGNKICPENCTSHVQNLTIDQLTGIWFSQVVTANEQSANSKCNFLNITEHDAHSFDLQSTDQNKLTNVTNTNVRVLVQFTPEGSLRSKLTFVFGGNFKYDHELLSVTKNHMIMITCFECGFYSPIGAGFSAYAMTREQYPRKSILDELKRLLTECGIPQESLLRHDQSDCPMC